MKGAVDRQDLERFRREVAALFGLRIDDGRLDQLRETLLERMALCRSDSASAYFARLASGADARSELRALAEKLMVGETYFFRNVEQFHAFVEVALPARLRARRDAEAIKILSAGCASGEEPYSLAILLRERFGGISPPVFAIDAVDVNPAMIRRAREARYSHWSLRETPKDIEERYFRLDGSDLVLSDALRTGVSFEEKNLLDPDPNFWRRRHYDVIFCRNVTMYFEPEVTRAVIARIADALVPEGFLFLGHAETLRGVSHDFHLRQTHGAFYYQRREPSEGSLPLAPVRGEGTSGAREVETPLTGVPPSIVTSTASWVEAIRRASEKIAALHDNRRGPALDTELEEGRPQGRSSPEELRGALELLERERFGDAIDALAALSPKTASNSDARLLRAVLLTNQGDLEAAEAACRGLLAEDELNAGAHYALALLRDHAGAYAEALEHDRAAIYLDPSFAMPHFHIGFVSKRRGDLDTARRELGRAILLLEDEDASRILLFGGGFTRESLIELCRTELAACGGGA